MNHETSQFENWPHPLAEDLRIWRRPGDDSDDYRMVLSISMDALTPVPMAEIQKLLAAGVPEISQLSD
jgi:hypothetical protein